jgi:ribosomal protein S18 acetylase RimI-like enzyme
VSAVSVECFGTAPEFLAAAEPWLAAVELDENLVYAAARLLASDDHPFREPYYLAVLRVDGAVAGCALRPPPDQLEISALPSGTAGALVGTVARRYPDLQTVAAPAHTALEFARAWAGAHGGSWRTRHRWRLHAVTSVDSPRAARGAFRQAAPVDWPLLEQWAPRYGRELNSTVDVAAFFARMLRLGSLYVWDDDGAKSVVAVSGNTPRGARLSAVYTPDEFRYRGYASNAVAVATRRALESGKAFCVVYADMSALAPLRLYRSLGFQPLRDHLLIDFS